eukprot:1002054-Prymnesium_polylepis.1
MGRAPNGPGRSGLAAAPPPAACPDHAAMAAKRVAADAVTAVKARLAAERRRLELKEAMQEAMQEALAAQAQAGALRAPVA